MRDKADGASVTASYRQGFDRIRAEYLEMPGMRLTVDQVRRLSGLDVAVCTAVLQDLVRARFLHVAEDGTYRRASADRLPTPVADRSVAGAKSPRGSG